MKIARMQPRDGIVSVRFRDYELVAHQATYEDFGTLSNTVVAADD